MFRKIFSFLFPPKADESNFRALFIAEVNEEGSKITFSRTLYCSNSKEVIVEETFLKETKDLEPFGKELLASIYGVPRAVLCYVAEPVQFQKAEIGFYPEKSEYGAGCQRVTFIASSVGNISVEVYFYGEEENCVFQLEMAAKLLAKYVKTGGACLRVTTSQKNLLEAAHAVQKIGSRK